MEGHVEKVVRAEAFELVDASGRTRATLAAEGNGACWLTFAGRDGARRAVFGMGENDCPSIELFDEQQQVRAGLLVTGMGPQLRLCGADGRAEMKMEITGILGSDMVIFTCAGAEGRPRVRTVLTDGHATLEVSAGDEQPAAQLAARPDGSLELGVAVQSTKPWAGLQMSADGASALTMRDRTGRLRVLLTLGSQGAPDLTFTDATGADRVALTFGEAERPRLFFVDRQRQVRVAFVIDSAGDPGLDLIAENGKRTVRFGFLGTGQLLMALLGDDAEPRVEITATGTDADSGIALGAPGGWPRLWLRAYGQGYSEAVMIDGREKRRLWIGLRDRGMPGIDLFDGARKEYRAALGLAEDGRLFAIIGGSRWRKKRVLMAP